MKRYYSEVGSTSVARGTIPKMDIDVYSIFGTWVIDPHLFLFTKEGTTRLERVEIDIDATSKEIRGVMSGTDYLKCYVKVTMIRTKERPTTIYGTCLVKVINNTISLDFS